MVFSVYDEAIGVESQEIPENLQIVVQCTRFCNPRTVVR